MTANFQTIKLLAPPFCWTKLPKKVTKFEAKFPKFGPKFAPKFALKIFVLSWQVEKSSPEISPAFSHPKFKFQIEFQIKFHQKFHKHTSAGLAAPKLAHSKFDCHGVSQKKERFWTISLSAPNVPPLPQKRINNFYFDCRLELTEFSHNSLSLPQNLVRSLFWRSTLETVLRLFPIYSDKNGLTTMVVRAEAARHFSACLFFPNSSDRRGSEWGLAHAAGRKGKLLVALIVQHSGESHQPLTLMLLIS